LSLLLQLVLESLILLSQRQKEGLGSLAFFFVENCLKDGSLLLRGGKAGGLLLRGGAETGPLGGLL
jgi:hypothetical protein